MMARYDLVDATQAVWLAVHDPRRDIRGGVREWWHMEPRRKQTLVVRPETSRWLAVVMQSRYWLTVPTEVKYSVVDECGHAEDVSDLSDEAWQHIRAAEAALKHET
jgi:hypothetical protein